MHELWETFNHFITHVDRVTIKLINVSKRITEWVNFLNQLKWALWFLRFWFKRIGVCMYVVPGWLLFMQVGSINQITFPNVSGFRWASLYPLMTKRWAKTWFYQILLVHLAISTLGHYSIAFNLAINQTGIHSMDFAGSQTLTWWGSSHIQTPYSLYFFKILTEFKFNRDIINPEF